MGGEPGLLDKAAFPLSAVALPRAIVLMRESESPFQLRKCDRINWRGKRIVQGEIDSSWEAAGAFLVQVPLTPGFEGRVESLIRRD